MQAFMPYNLVSILIILGVSQSQTRVTGSAGSTEDKPTTGLSNRALKVLLLSSIAMHFCSCFLLAHVAYKNQVVRLTGAFVPPNTSLLHQKKKY